MTWFLDSCLDKSTIVSHHQISLFNIRILLGNRTSKHANQLNRKYAIFRDEYQCIYKLWIPNYYIYTKYSWCFFQFMSICNILILASLNLLRQTPYYYPKIERKEKKVSKLNLISSGMLLCVLCHYIWIFYHFQAS